MVGHIVINDRLLIHYHVKLTISISEEGLGGLEGDCMGGRPRWPGGWLYGRREASVAWRMTVWEEEGIGGREGG